MKIEFTTKQIDKKLYSKLILKYIFDHYHYKDRIRIMLPRSMKDGLLRICATDEYGNLYRENQTIISKKP